VDAAFIQFDRFFLQKIVILDDVDVRMAGLTGCGQVQWVNVRIAIRRGKDFVGSVAAPALGNVRILTDLHLPVLGVYLGDILVAFTAVDDWNSFPVRSLGRPVDAVHRHSLMAIRTFQSFVRRLGEDLRRGVRTARPRLVVAVRTSRRQGLLVRRE
jgi:hypothetical protein